MTNRLHGQAIKAFDSRNLIDAHAQDGTPEATDIRVARGCALAVPWYPECDTANNPAWRLQVTGFEGAVRAFATDRRFAGRKSA